jgi:hypothetical protein
VGADLKNVIVFTLGGVRQAAELRWVREVISLGFVTAVPTAPAGIAGAFNLRGHLVPVLDIAALDPRTRDAHAPASAPRQGDGALLVEIDGVAAALRVDKVEEVATLQGGDGGQVIDGRGRTLALIDPPALVRRAMADAHAVRTADDAAAIEAGHHG